MKKVPRQSLSQVKRIAIDEIYAGKLHKFMTIVLDLDSAQVIYVGAGRGSEALRPFVKKLLKSKAQIKAVAIDMAGGYIKAVKEFLPQATLVFDRFHITKLMNEKLTKLRRDEYNQATNQEHKDVLKGVRWLLLRNSETRSSKRKSKLVGQPSNKFVTEQRRAYGYRNREHLILRIETLHTTRIVLTG